MNSNNIYYYYFIILDKKKEKNIVTFADTKLIYHNETKRRRNYENDLSKRLKKQNINPVNSGFFHNIKSLIFDGTLMVVN